MSGEYQSTVIFIHSLVVTFFSLASFGYLIASTLTVFCNYKCTAASVLWA